MKTTCLICQIEFKTYPSRIKKGRNKYCHRKSDTFGGRVKSTQEVQYA